MHFWCPIVGLEVEIFTESMTYDVPRFHSEKTKVWKLTKESVEKIYDVLGCRFEWARPGHVNGLCEHMLEMD